jgi:hypothetical protein
MLGRCLLSDSAGPAHVSPRPQSTLERSQGDHVGNVYVALGRSPCGPEGSGIERSQMRERELQFPAISQLDDIRVDQRQAVVPQLGFDDIQTRLTSQPVKQFLLPPPRDHQCV